VTPYDAPASAGPFDLSRKVFESLIIELSGERGAAISHAELEELIAGRGRELLRQLLQDHLDLRAIRERAELSARAAAGLAPAGRTRIEYGHHRALATVVGSVTVRCAALRAPGEPNLYPADVVLSLPAGRASHGVRKQAGGRCGPILLRHNTFGDHRPVRTGRRETATGENLVTAAAVDVDAFYTAAIPAPAGADTLLVVSADAKGTVMRPDGLRAATRAAAGRARAVFRTRLGPGEKPNRKRMATLACVYDADPAPRRPHDVISVPGGPRGGERGLRPGPRARNKWLTASVTDTPEQVIAAAFDHAEARDPTHARTWIGLVDGGWHQIQILEAEAARRGIALPSSST